MIWKTNFAIKIMLPVAAILAFTVGDLYAAPTEQQCVAYKVNLVEQLASFASFSTVFPKIMTEVSKRNFDQAYTIAHEYSGEDQVIAKYLGDAIMYTYGINNSGKNDSRSFHSAISFSGDTRNINRYSKIVHALEIADAMVDEKTDVSYDTSVADLLNKWSSDSNPDHILYAARMSHAVYKSHNGKWGVEKVNYGSALAHLRFLNESMGVAEAKPYVGMVEEKIDRLSSELQETNRESYTKAMDTLIQCNTKQS